MFMVQALLAADISALAVVLGSGVHLVRRGYQQALTRMPAVDSSTSTMTETQADHGLITAPFSSQAEFAETSSTTPPRADFATRIAMAARLADVPATSAEVFQAQTCETGDLFQWSAESASMTADGSTAASKAAEEADFSLFVTTPDRQQMGWIDEVGAQVPPSAKAMRPSDAEAAPLPAELELDLLADPVDGVAFEPGEQIVLCVCRTAYRVPTLEWLRENTGGACVQCQRTLSDEHQYILPSAIQNELSLAN